jgi:curved DNA-binding protein CbpA
MENMGAPGSVRPVGGEVVRLAVATEPRVEAAPQSTDEEQLAAAIDERFHEVQAKKDYFTLLRVPRTANTEEVKNAFLQLAKVFHPDRLPSSLHPLSPKITAIFEAIREAYETLQVESKRKAYLASLDAANPSAQAKTANGAAEAVEALKAGDVLMRKKDFAAAEQEYHRANQLDPKPIYRAAEAWAIYLDPTRKAEAAVAKQMMTDALRSDPSCDRAQYQLGVIARVEGAIDRAEKYFREALRINPKHVEAAQELRIIEMRKKGSAKRGFFR